MDRIVANVVRRAGYLNVGDLILYGKWKNARARILSFGVNEKGDPTVEVQPVDKDGNDKKGKPKTLTLLKVRKIQAMTIADRVATRYLEKTARGIGLGDDWENGKVRIHRYADHFKVWDLANAGRRGKKVRIMTIAPVVRHEAEWMENNSRFITQEGTYDRIKRFYEDVLQDFPGEIRIEEHQRRGIDILPGGTRTIKLRWSIGDDNLDLSATPLDFGVTSSVLMGGGGKPSFRQDTLYWPRKKADAKRFYAWLSAEGESKVKRMDIMVLRKLWKDIGVQYDYH